MHGKIFLAPMIVALMLALNAQAQTAPETDAPRLLK
jgi:hypothetical protein